jgi:hypothetical protein
MGPGDGLLDLEATVEYFLMAGNGTEEKGITTVNVIDYVLNQEASSDAINGIGTNRGCHYKVLSIIDR